MSRKKEYLLSFLSSFGIFRTTFQWREVPEIPPLCSLINQYNAGLVAAFYIVLGGYCIIAGLLPKIINIIIKDLVQKMFIQIPNQFFEEKIHIEQRYHLQQ